MNGDEARNPFPAPSAPSAEQIAEARRAKRLLGAVVALLVFVNLAIIIVAMGWLDGAEEAGAPVSVEQRE